MGTQSLKIQDVHITPEFLVAGIDRAFDVDIRDSVSMFDQAINKMTPNESASPSYQYSHR